MKNNKSIDQNLLEAAVVAELVKFEGLSLAVSSSALRAGGLPVTEMYRAVVNNFNAMRSGDVFIVFGPNWYINDIDGLTVASTHGSRGNYDTCVPLVFAGAGLDAQHVDRKVLTVYLATRLPAYMGTKFPSGSAGTPLKEVVED